MRGRVRWYSGKIWYRHSQDRGSRDGKEGARVKAFKRSQDLVIAWMKEVLEKVASQRLLGFWFG